MTEMNLTEAVAVDRRTGLIALRDRLARQLEDPGNPPHVVTPLSRQLAAVLKELSEIRDPAAPDSLAEELRRRSEARRRLAYGDGV